MQAAQAYDSLASRYDDLLALNPVLAHSARVSMDLVKDSMSKCDFVLEIGCGTGRETLELAAMGKRIVACDPSKASLDVLRRKASDLGLEHMVEPRELPASRIPELVEEFGFHAFDGAYSSFALSYEPDLSVIPRRVWELLEPDSPFLCSIFNRYCLTELMVLAPFLLPRRGLRRLEGETKLPVDKYHVVVKSYTPSKVKRIFASHFSLIRLWALPAIVPPHYLHRLMELSGGLRSVWEDLDRRVNDRWPLKYLGSHTAFLFRSLRSSPSES